MESLRITVAVAAWLCIALPAGAQSPGTCLGGRDVTGFQLMAQAPNEGEALPIDVVNDVAPGDTLHYNPAALPAIWRGSAHVAVLLVPAADNGDERLDVFSTSADKPAEWKVTQPVSVIAFMFGPEGLNVGKTKSLLGGHPELVAKFTQYATTAARVEALVSLFATYEASAPGSLDLTAMLKEYAAEYGVSMPKVNAALTPDEEAADLLAAVAPPTSDTAPSSHAVLTSGSTSTATALASLYFGPEVGIADDTLPLVRALHQSLFPGIEFQGAFALDGTNDGTMALCVANTAAPAQKKPVYIWTVSVPGGAPPTLSTTGAATLPDGWQASVSVSTASVAQLHQILRLRQWELVAGKTAVPVPVAVTLGDVHDTLAVDLRKVKLAPGAYRLAARWDWTPVEVSGVINVKPIPSLAAAALAPGVADRLVAGSGTVSLDVTGADFSFVNKLELLPKGAADGAIVPVTFHPPAAEADRLVASLDTSKLVPGSYTLRMQQVNGAHQDVTVAIHPPNPVLEKLPLSAHVDESAQAVVLHGSHLELIRQISSPGANWTLAPATPGTALTERDATITLAPAAKVGDSLPLSLTVEGLDDPIEVPAAVRVLGPRPSIHGLTASLTGGNTVTLLPGELPADAIANFAFTVEHASGQPDLRLRCGQADDGTAPLTLHPGQPVGAQEFDAGGDGLYYLAVTPGKIGDPGCELQMTVMTEAGGASAPVKLGRVVRLPHIDKFTLSDQSAGVNEFAGQLTGENLQLIAATGWGPDAGVPVAGIPLRNADGVGESLAIVMPWPPPSPHAPLYIWLRGESQGRKTTITP